MIRHVILSLAAAAALAACATGMGGAKPDAHAAIAAAVADKNRPEADVARDAARKPAEMLAFAGVKPGDKVVDFIPGGGYFTRIFSVAVGPNGHVFAAAPPGQNGAPAPVAAIAANPAYSNITVLPLTVGTFATPEPVDIIWTSQNYHDLHLTRLNVDVPALNKAIYAALKPGGVFIVLDHAALPGTGLDVPDKLHRINPDIVKQEVTAAGFVFEGESNVLRNPDDPKTASVFDPSIRGKTDQFIYKFRKPK
jgi:predicted methyltransferase